jgi:exopolyphosphatase/guanosine-5'-triphosphate,3'-diphosphate pyrophosphatase
MRLAAIDLGSNSFHLLVVEARLDGSFVPLAREKEMLRLGDRVARDGRIGEWAMAGAVEVVRRFKALADAQRADEIVALGTAALREARDGIELVERIQDATGIDVEVVDGLREAELIFRAIRSSVLIEPSPVLAADLGGGSLELMVGDRGGLAFAASLRLGVGRLTAECVRSDPISRKDMGRLRDRVRGELLPVLESEIAELGPKMLVGASGTLLCVARMAIAARDGSLPAALNQLSVPADAFASLSQQVIGMRSADRQRLPGCDARRAEHVPAGLVVLETLFEATGLDELTLSEWALREGAVLEAIGTHDPAELGDDPRALRRFSVLSLCRRCSWRSRHARHVAAVAAELFLALEPVHGLAPEDMELLELGALLHDIGEHVARAGHDRHGAYLIENGGLRGFAPDEVRILSVLARYHIRGTPKPSFDAFGALGPAGRARATGLTALLRLADALDASHTARVGEVRLVDQESGDKPAIELAARSRGDAELEQWTFWRKKELFEKTFGVELRLAIEEIGPRGIDLLHGDAAGLA